MVLGAIRPFHVSSWLTTSINASKALASCACGEQSLFRMGLCTFDDLRIKLLSQMSTVVHTTVHERSQNRIFGTYKKCDDDTFFCRPWGWLLVIQEQRLILLDHQN